MPVIGFNFNKIEAYVEPDKPKGNINVNSRPTIKNVAKKELKIPGVENAVSVEFNFEITYEPKLGGVTLAGEVLYKTNNNTKKLLDTWKKDKKMEEKMGVEVMNTIFRKCLTRAVPICEDLRLPPPINFPIVKKKE